VLAPRPTAGSTLTFFQLFLRPPDAALPGHLLLGILDPTNELVSRQGRDVLPGSERGVVGDQRLAQVCGQLVHRAAGHSLVAHGASVVARPGRCEDVQNQILARLGVRVTSGRSSVEQTRLGLAGMFAPTRPNDRVLRGIMQATAGGGDLGMAWSMPPGRPVIGVRSASDQAVSSTKRHSHSVGRHDA
jgi:hypothetical protein